MGETKILKYITIIIVNMLFLFIHVRSEVVYTVGDEEGWTSDSNFGSWSHKYNFSVGDVLVFKYVKGQHNVYEVMEKTYRSCDTSSGVIAKYESGNDEIKLTQQKKYWFICNVDGHCLGGMRFEIDVKRQSISTSNGEPIPPPTSSTTKHALDPWNIYCLVAFGILFKFN
ncbi:mavicyanin-like [Jatropha curcas]|uniref:mavicyanin-like n=1 Tax=Jatropha curcas TaxID=180498 RepID=UPI0005FB41D4|nr:mavicyanin-like [Jatropha curcas]